MKSATFVSHNILSVGVETNGLQGGDSGHGGYALVRLSNDSCTCMSVEVETHDFNPEVVSVPEVGELVITVRGDTEILTLASALEWAARELKSQVAGKILDSSSLPYSSDFLTGHSYPYQGDTERGN